MLYSHLLVSAFLQVSITPCWTDTRWAGMRSLKLKVSVPRGGEDAVWEWAEEGRQRERGTERHTQRGAHRKETEWQRMPSHGPSVCAAHLHMCPSQRVKSQTGVMWTCGKKELQRMWTNAQKSRALSDNPGTVYHFSVLRTRFWKSYC